MSRSTERVVWILGAGFSKPLGGPLFSELLGPEVERWVTAWLDLKGLPNRGGRFGARSIYERGHERGLWSNAEKCLELVDEARTDRLAMQFLRPTFGKMAGDWPTKMWVKLSQFVSVATSYFVDRASSPSGEPPEVWDCYQKWADLLTEDDAIVTFNYDRVVETLLGGRNRQELEVVCAKLHGTVPGAKELEERIKEGLGIETISMPGPRKARAAKGESADAWKRAEQKLAQATRVVIVGYSFPPTDPVVRRLVLAHINKESLGNVDIVVGSETTGAEIASMFERHVKPGVVLNTKLLAQQYLARGTAKPDDGRFNHFRPTPSIFELLD